MRRLIVDVSSIVWTSLFSGTDKEFGRKVTFNEKEVQVNSAGYGYDNAIKFLTDNMAKYDFKPYQVILVKEGENSKQLRQMILKQYKNSGGEKAPELYEEFGKARDMLIDAMCNVGASCCTQSGLEADDVIAYLAKSLGGERYILSNDGDLIALVDKDVHVIRRGTLDENHYGPFPFKYIPIYKALVGDTSDNYPGARGFGEKAFLDLICLFGVDALGDIEKMIQQGTLQELADNVSDLKALQKVVDNMDMVRASYNVALMYPEKVNTWRKPLEWRAGMVKPLTAETEELLKPWAGRVRLVTKENYDQAVKWAVPLIQKSPFISIDIETSSCDEADAWLENLKKKADDGPGVDVFGAKLTGLGLTFGDNQQYTFYFSIDHADTENVTSFQVLELMDQIPESIPHVVHNHTFEMTILAQEWAKYWENSYQGFLPNVYDTALLSSYVDENRPKGLKKLSKAVLDYEQETYDEVTTKEGREGTLPKGGKLISLVEVIDGEETYKVEKRSYRMNELSAKDVLSYGADDTICTAALFNHFRMICELEKTWEVFKQVELKPQYVNAKAFLNGVRISLETLKKCEKEDNETYDNAWKVVEAFLIEKGWEGSAPPSYEILDASTVKDAFQRVFGFELETRVRTVSKFVPLIRELATKQTEDHIQGRMFMFASMVEQENLKTITAMVAQNFERNVVLDFGSPKQLRNFFYNTLNLPVRIINPPTDNERETKPELADACDKHRALFREYEGAMPLTDEELELVKQKAATDDVAIAFALAYDAPEGVKERDILNAVIDLKTIQTRRGLYYKPYPLNVHWKDNRIHSAMNQSATVTRRYSSSGPNLQQLPKNNDGIRIRQVIVPHKRKAVICSIDFSGQELRLMAGQSLDPNMMACYVGDNLKDPHSITASGAMLKKWSRKEFENFCQMAGVSPNMETYELFMALKSSDAKEVAKAASDLRKLGKNVNFAAQFDCAAPKLAQMLVMEVKEAQLWLDAKYAMFPRVETYKDEVRAQSKADGFVTTMMGGRRHLGSAFKNPDRQVAGKAERQGPNFEIQGSAAEMTKLAMGRVWDSGVLYNLDMEFIAPIHDELVWSVIYEDCAESIAKVHSCMTQPYSTLPVPILGSISLGPNFGMQIELGDEPNRGKIDYACKVIEGMGYDFDLEKAQKLVKEWKNES